MMDVPEKTAASAGDAAVHDPVRRWTLLLLLAVVLLLAWYLRADRITPSTTQARLHAVVIPIAAEVAGTVSGVSVANNQPVNAGDPLFQIDIERFQLAVKTARAALDQARQAESAGRANIDAALAQLDSAIASEERQRLDTERVRAIREQDPGAISQRRLESAEASLVSAQSRVTAARAALEAAIRQLGEEGDRNAQVQQAQVGLDNALLNLERATVRAPGDGVVTGVRLDRGNFAAAGAPQMTFIGLRNVWVQAEFTENNLGHIDAGDRVGIVFDVYPGRVFRGRVREVGFGVSLDDPPLGALPTIKNDKAWLRDAQRYPVLVDVEQAALDGPLRLKVGSQATVLVFTGDHLLFNALAHVQLWLQAWLSYAY
jgi:multidrug resistance efflux pump